MKLRRDLNGVFLLKWDVHLNNEISAQTKWLIAQNYNKLLPLFWRMAQSTPSSKDNTLTHWIAFLFPPVCAEWHQEPQRCDAKTSKYTMSAQMMWLTRTECLLAPRTDPDSICCQPSGSDQRHLTVLSDVSNTRECVMCVRGSTQHLPSECVK